MTGKGFKTSRLRYLFFWKTLSNQRSPQGLVFKKIKIKEGGVHPIEGFPNATRQKPEHSSLAQQEHVDRPDRHTIHTTSAGMANANGPSARGNRYLSQVVVGTGAASGAELWRRRYNPKGDGC